MFCFFRLLRKSLTFWQDLRPLGFLAKSKILPGFLGKILYFSVFFLAKCVFYLVSWVSLRLFGKILDFLGFLAKSNIFSASSQDLSLCGKILYLLGFFARSYPSSNSWHEISLLGKILNFLGF